MNTNPDPSTPPPTPAPTATTAPVVPPPPAFPVPSTPLPPAGPRLQPVPTPASLVLEPMENPGLLSACEALLKKPGRVLHQLNEPGSTRLAVGLLLVTLLFLALFGFLLGTFSGGQQLWAAPVKVAAGLLFSAVICFPSLYVFSCLGGLDVRVSRVAALLLAALSLTGLLLLAFSPVVWIFSQASESLVFIGLLALVFWLISLGTGFSLLRRAARLFGLNRSGHLVIWMGIFLLVALQMSTSLRPIIGKADTQLPTQKKFFLEHWFDTMNAPRKPTPEIVRE